MPSTWVEKAAGTSETARASRQQDRERIQREKEQEEAAAKQRLAEEKERHGKEAGAMEAEAQKGEEGIAHDSDDAARGSVPKDAESEPRQINKRPTATERLLAENKAKAEEEALLKDERQQRDLAQQAEKDEAREKKAEADEANAKKADEEEQKKRSDDEREDVTQATTMGEDKDQGRETNTPSDTRDPQLSPLRKKNRKEKKKRTKKNKRDKEPVVPTFADMVLESPPSLIRQGKFSGTKAPAEEKREEELQQYDHKFKRYLWDMAIELCAEDKYAEFTLALRSLYENGVKVDNKLVIEPVMKGKGRKITRMEDIPFNHTDLGMNIRVQGGGYAFAMKKPWKKNLDDDNNDDEELINPVVKFTIAFSSDERPEDMMERVDAEWGKLGGRKTWPRAIPAFITTTPVVLYRIHNGGHRATLLKEFETILAEARDLATLEDPDYVHAHKAIPPMGLQPKVPRVPGQDTTLFTNWTKKQQWLRKCLHVEVDRNEAQMVQDLVTEAKERNLIAPVWGKSVRLSNVADDDTRHVDLADLASYVKHHINYHASMTGDGLPGIINLDKEVPFFAASDPNRIVGHMSLRYALYRFMKLADGHSLFAELHQESPLASVDAVIPNTPEAETMVLMMKRNIGAFLHFYFEGKMDERFKTDLLKASIDPSLLHEIEHCTWDPLTKVLLTPNEEKAKEAKTMEDAAWYHDEFAALTGADGTKGKKKKSYANAEMLYDMDGDQSVQTLHNRPGKGYAGSPGAARLDLGKKNNTSDGMDIDTAEGDDMSALSCLSKGELLERLRRTTLAAKDTGPRPDNDNKSSSDDSGESSSYDSSSSSTSDEEDPPVQSAAGKG